MRVCSDESGGKIVRGLDIEAVVGQGQGEGFVRFAIEVIDASLVQQMESNKASKILTTRESPTRPPR